MSFLTKEEERVLGSLIEKKHTTPEYYPLTLNALRSACNQKSNRDPVVSYSDEDVEVALNSLFEKKLVFKVSGAGQRVTKYNENFSNHFNFSVQQTAVMCVLMLRGAQTVGEIRSRAARIHNFKDLGEVENTLQSLINYDSDEKLVIKLPRSTGRDPRYASVISGEPELKEEKKLSVPTSSGIDELKAELQELKASLEKFREEFEDFKKQFD
jgi:uncharacterized protein YceH (UPF0502 family)